jgi:hypothetical protein
LNGFKQEKISQTDLAFDFSEILELMVLDSAKTEIYEKIADLNFFKLKNFKKSLQVELQLRPLLL